MKVPEIKHKRAAAYLGMLVILLLWGTTPVLNKKIISSYSPALMIGLRATVAAAFVGAVAGKRLKALDRSYLKTAGVSGAALGFAYVVQTVGLQYTTPAKSAFLENVSCIVVPIVLFFATKKRISVFQLLSALVCLAGVGVLSFDGNAQGLFSFGAGELLSCLGGVLYGVNIALMGVFGKDKNALVYAFVQMLAVAAAGLFYAFLFEEMRFSLAPTDLLLLVYLGVIPTGLSWILRSVCQKHVNAAVVGVIMPFGAVITGVTSALCGEDTFGPSLFLGGTLCVSAIVLSEAGETLRENGKSIKKQRKRPVQTLRK